jgi:homoserine dehydrogenase
LSSKTYRFILTGVGSVGKDLLRTLLQNGSLLQERYGLILQLVGAADSGGVVANVNGLDMSALLAHKENGRSVGQFAGGQPNLPPAALFDLVEADLLLEATPTNLQDGQPGLDLVKTALQKGMHAVLASKGPLVLAFAELAALSDWRQPGAPALRFSGAVGSPLPSVSVGMRDLAGGNIRQIEAVVNGTTQLILQLMGEGQSYAEALKVAQAKGIAEPDPSLDVDGWDSANKLVILANTVLRQPSKLADVAVQGIRELPLADIQAATAAGGRMSLVARALWENGRYSLSVAPVALPPDHDLARLYNDSMGIVYDTDVFGRLALLCANPGIGTGAAMMKDVIGILTD